MSRPEQANWLLIDGVLSPWTLADLFLREASPEIYPLYQGTRWESLHDLGPILLKPSAGSSLIKDWFGDPAAQRYSTLLCSAESPQKVTSHLRHFICPPDALGGNGLLRFSDPLVAHYWLSSFSNEQRDQQLGPIDHWWVRQPTHSWEPQPETSWQLFSRTAPGVPWEAHHANLGHAQLAALDQAHRWKFEEDAYLWLIERSEQTFAGLNSQQTSDWLKDTLEAGMDWGLVGEKALIIWLETCLDLGGDFATRSDSPYQTWLGLNPEHARLAPEVRIKAFDHSRYPHEETAHG